MKLIKLHLFNKKFEIPCQPIIALKNECILNNTIK